MPGEARHGEQGGRGIRGAEIAVEGVNQRFRFSTISQVNHFATILTGNEIVSVMFPKKLDGNHFANW